MKKRRKKRRNPSLIVLSNPGVPPAPAAWEKFHLRPGDRARMTQIPDIPGIPPMVVALGECEGVVMVDIHGDEEEVDLDPTRREGPWLATDESMKRLWIVAPDPITDLLAYEGYRCKAVRYRPNSNSGKYSAGSGFEHVFGEGGKYPKSQWSAKAYPLLVMVDPDARAYEFQDGIFTVTDRGIVS